MQSQHTLHILPGRLWTLWVHVCFSTLLMSPRVCRLQYHNWDCTSPCADLLRILQSQHVSHIYKLCLEVHCLIVDAVPGLEVEIQSGQLVPPLSPAGGHTRVTLLRWFSPAGRPATHCEWCGLVKSHFSHALIQCFMLSVCVCVVGRVCT